jgi:hypothetical protein
MKDLKASFIFCSYDDDFFKLFRCLQHQEIYPHPVEEEYERQNEYPFILEASNLLLLDA